MLGQFSGEHRAGALPKVNAHFVEIFFWEPPLTPSLGVGGTQLSTLFAAESSEIGPCRARQTRAVRVHKTVQAFDRKRRFCCNRGFPGSCRVICITPASPATYPRKHSHGHEAHLPALEDSPRTHARLPCAHEDARRSRRHQCSPRQRPQAPGSLSLRVALNGASPSGPLAVRRLVHKADFVRLLNVSAKERSTHFAVHHLAIAPLPPARRLADAESPKLSTDDEQVLPQDVDNSPDALWIGCVVPKRHARRSVTRSLLKRQIRNALQRHAGALPRGQWLIRLRSAFAPKLFVSAASLALADTIRRELDALLSRAAAAVSA